MPTDGNSFLKSGLDRSSIFQTGPAKLVAVAGFWQMTLVESKRSQHYLWSAKLLDYPYFPNRMSRKANLERQGILDDYKSSLNDLTFNSKPMINVLTMLAEENEMHADGIARVIRDRIKMVCELSFLEIIQSAEYWTAHASQFGPKEMLVHAKNWALNPHEREFCKPRLAQGSHWQFVTATQLLQSPARAIFHLAALHVFLFIGTGL